MSRQFHSQGSEFEKTIGYSRAVRDGRWVMVAGTTGFDYATMSISEDPADQAEQTMRNIDEALRAVGASMRDVIRVTYILPDAADFEPCWPALRKWLGQAAPAATMMVAGLYDPRMKIEIEVTALIRED
ncbi:RidA family protein [Pontivivens insulae]|uniref:2-iminobutanoate/2-iminopropanoate deaminase n=1 Tax=Pontivivens insulae TaxID=1639689 RepID=A0A2R8AAF7_9RHOB|nr:RidA family protein [Pontivivens insulae]RED12975.1 enamine deaminase RidA (YjgF/YER057c/UK114 family) [Pontivivens insulae]SPF29068.1 2-iminobutanoate/2-iminopropanoate deaminase [Pontivivens insulae]